MSLQQIGRTATGAVALTLKLRETHVHILGSTGTGKS